MEILKNVNKGEQKFDFRNGETKNLIQAKQAGLNN